MTWVGLEQKRVRAVFQVRSGLDPVSMSLWIRIQRQKCPINKEKPKSSEIQCFELLDFLIGRLHASPLA